MPQGADFISAAVSEEQRLIWIGCQFSLLIVYDFQFNYVGSTEHPGYEFTAACISTSKRHYGLFGTSDGTLFNVRINKEFE